MRGFFQMSPQAGLSGTRMPTGSSRSPSLAPARRRDSASSPVTRSRCYNHEYRMKEWSLQKRVLFLALAPLTVAVLLLSLHFTNARIQDLEDALRNRGQTIATQLATISEDAFQ